MDVDMGVGRWHAYVLIRRVQIGTTLMEKSPEMSLR